MEKFLYRQKQICGKSGGNLEETSRGIPACNSESYNVRAFEGIPVGFSGCIPEKVSGHIPVQYSMESIEQFMYKSLVDLFENYFFEIFLWVHFSTDF